MDILVTGGYGFIGSKIVSELVDKGYKVVVCGRNVSRFASKFVNVKHIEVDFSVQKSVAEWQALLNEFEIGIIINCVGILKGKTNEIWNVHYHTPRALIEATLKMNLKRVVQISALGVDKIKLPFTESKKALDDYLMTLPIPAIIVRPSLVYSSGSYGGTSLLRGMAGLPGVIPVPGKGDQYFQPIHLQDLSQSVLNLLYKEKSQILIAVGSEQYSLKEILILFRQWLGFKHAIFISFPVSLMTSLAKWMGKLSKTFSSTLLDMLMQHNVASKQETKEFLSAIGFVPKNFEQGLFQSPSFVQDRWHARLYFLRPLLRISIGLVWLWTGVTSLFLYPESQSLAGLHRIVNLNFGKVILYGSSWLDLILGVVTLLNYRIRLTGTLQIILIFIYTCLITVITPQIWLSPFGPVLKNLPLIAATAVMIALETNR